MRQLDRNSIGWLAAMDFRARSAQSTLSFGGGMGVI
jgi:hypothetical protein